MRAKRSAALIFGFNCIVIFAAVFRRKIEEEGRQVQLVLQHKNEEVPIHFCTAGDARKSVPTPLSTACAPPPRARQVREGATAAPRGERPSAPPAPTTSETDGELCKRCWVRYSRSPLEAQPKNRPVHISWTYILHTGYCSTPPTLLRIKAPKCLLLRFK